MAEYYAFSAIDDAIERTKKLLWPFNWSIWWRIAVVSLFTGGFGGINFISSSPGDTTSELPNLDMGVSGIPDIIIGIIIAVILIAVIFTFLSSVFQFVFVKGLSENEFRLRQYFKENIGRGLKLFGFWIAMILIIFAALAIFLLSIFAAGFASNPFLIIPEVLLLLLVILVVCIISLFTVDFVVPVMLKDDCGVIEGWKKCWEILKSSPSQSLIYLIMKVVISIVTAILLILAAVIALLVIGIPFFVLFLLLGIGLGFSILNVILLVLFLIIVIPVVIIISVPFSTFIRTYSLSVLGEMDPEYRLIE